MAANNLDNLAEGSVLLDETQQRHLLEIARKAIEATAGGNRYEPVIDAPYLELERGVFVSLHIDGMLRGCLGRFEADGIQLGRLVSIMAGEAASHDPRFPAVRLQETSLIDIEISVLTPLEKVNSPEDVVPGKHGLYIVGRDPAGFSRSGTLLPQVATDHNWDRNTFLDQTCIKAGLPEDTWKFPDTQIFVYQAQVFGEESLGMLDNGKD